MNKDDFMKFVEENIKYHLPESFANCRFEAGKQLCLIVSEGNSPDAIRLHLEEVYDTFTEDRNIFSALEFIAKNVEEAWFVTGKMDETKEQLRGYINNYEEAKKHLQIVLSDLDVESVLANSVVTQVGAFNAQYRLLLDSFNLESEMSVHVTKNMLDKWGVTAEQLHQDALSVEGRWNKPVLVDAFDIINHLRFNFSKPMNLLENNGAKLDGQSLYTLTNENAYKGAGMLAHSEVLEQIGSLFSDNNYYILPSSKHELLILLDDGSKSVKELREMVQYVNEKEVSAQDLLSDKILYYNSKEKVLELAVDKAENLSKEITNTKQEDVAKNTAKQPKKTAEFTPRM